jgi:hypothetical protein
MDFIDTGVSEQAAGFVDSQDVYGPEYTRPKNMDDNAILNKKETPQEASTRIDQQASATFTNAATKAIDSKEDPVQVSETITNGEEKLFGIYSKDDLYIEDDVISRNPDYKAAEHLYYRNLQILSEEIEQAATEQEGKGIIGYGVDLVDREIIRATAFGWYENLTNRTAREGSRVLSNLFSINDPKEMRQFAKDYVDDIRSEGLGSDNAFSYAQMVREVYGKGYNPDAAYDKLFGALDLAGFVGVTGKVIKIGSKISRAASLRSSTAATRAGALGGVDEANRVAENLHIRDVDPLNTANLQASAVDLNPAAARPSLGFSQRIEATNDIISKIIPEEARGAVPTAARAIDVNPLIVDATTKFARAFKVPIYDAKVVPIDNQTSSVEFFIGRNEDGVPFKALNNGSAPSGAIKVAQRTGGEVIPIDPQNLSLGYVIKVSEALDLSKGLKGGFNIKLAQTLWTQTLGKLYDNNLIASPAARDVKELNQLALRSQSASKYLSNEGQTQKAIIGKLNYEDNSTLNAILDDLGNGPDPLLRQSWNETELRARWLTATGEQASPKVLAAFKAAENLSDAAYYFKSQEILKTYISKGFKNSVQVETDVFIPARRVQLSSLKEDAKVFDKKNGVKVYAREIDDLPGDAVLWELSSPWNKQDYILFPEATQVISPRSVLGYSAYNRRTNPLANYFLFLKGERGIKTILSTFSDSTAQSATKELRAIQLAYKAENATDDTIDAAIQANNLWNPSINTKAEMDFWLNENGKIDIADGDILSKMRDEPIDDPFDKVFGGEKAADYVYNSFSRSDNVLTEYGGAASYNPSPLKSIVEQYGSAAHQYANSVYTYRSMQGWIDQVRIMQDEGINLGVKVGEGSNYKRLFLSTEITGSSPQAVRMRYLQDTIKRRLGMSSPMQDRLKVVADALAEQFYDSTGKRVELGGAESALLKTGFFSAFAFNPSQAFLQASQVANTVAIVGWDVGSRALAGSVHLRKILSMSDDVAVEQLGLRNFAKTMKISDADAVEIAELFRQTLPNLVMGDSVELGTGLLTGKSTKGLFGKTGFQATKIGQAMFDIGLKPFNFGEATAKSNAFVAATLEFRKANPGVSFLSEAARNNIAARSETLVNNMSNTSRSAIQSGLGKVPTQWLSYFFRTTEQVFVGRDLTKLERAKLGFMLMPFYGFTGLGAGFLTEKVAEVFNLDPNDDTDKAIFITMKYGLLDGFLSHFTPFDVALSERMAPIPAVYDIYDKFTEENVLTALGGPSGGIAVTGVEAIYNLLTSLARGQTSTLTEDSMRILRNFSGINSLAKASGILFDETYRNRKGLIVPIEVDVVDAIISVTGFTPLQVTEYYNQTGRVFDLSKDYNAIQKEVLEKSKLAWSIYAKDPVRASSILRDSQVLISKAPLNYSKKTQLLRLLNPKVEDYSYILKTLYENDKGYSASWANTLLKKD